MKIERTHQTIAFLDLDIGSPFWAHGRLFVRTGGTTGTELKSSPDLNVKKFDRGRSQAFDFTICGTVKPMEGPYGFANNDKCELVEAVSITEDKPKERRYQDVDLGYTLFCSMRGVSRDPMGWLNTSQQDKDIWAKQAVQFLTELGVEAP